MADRKFFVCGFWKCEGTYWQVKKIKAILSQGEVPPSSIVEVVVCPPRRSFQYLEGSPRPDFQIASEACLFEVDPSFPWGPRTATLVEEGLQWVVLGRSDREFYLRDGNEVVGVKVAYALGHGLKVIARVGETIEQREAGKTMEVLAAQTKAIAERVTTGWKNIVLAYVPVWAVGTGKAATPAQAQEVHAELRNFLRANVSPEVAATIRIIYGGKTFLVSYESIESLLSGVHGTSPGKSSVGSANCKALAFQPDIDGLFVGGASIKSEFIEIIKSGDSESQVGRLSEGVGHLLQS